MCGSPWHAAVDGEVEGVGEADDHVDEEGDVAHQVVVQEVVGDAANREHDNMRPACRAAAALTKSSIRILSEGL